MISANERLKDITHPLVTTLYLKEDFGASGTPHSTLVIRTNFNFANDQEPLLDLLEDLDELRDRAREKGARFDHIDIRPA